MKDTFVYASPGNDKGHNRDRQVTEGVEDTTEMVGEEQGGDSLQVLNVQEMMKTYDDT